MINLQSAAIARLAWELGLFSDAAMLARRQDD
jgi:hypothetical protein